MKITSKTSQGELVRTFVLKEGGKELEMVWFEFDQLIFHQFENFLLSSIPAHAM